MSLCSNYYISLSLADYHMQNISTCPLHSLKAMDDDSLENKTLRY